MAVMVLLGTLVAAVISFCLADALPRRWPFEKRAMIGLGTWVALTCGQYQLVVEWQASGRREGLIRSCRRTMESLRQAVDLYRQDNDGDWPDALSALYPKHIKHPLGVYCPVPAIQRGLDRLKMTCAPEYSPSGEMYHYRIVCKDNADPMLIPEYSDYAYTVPSGDEQTAILLEEKNFNHSRGWWPRGRTLRHIMRADGSVEMIEKK